METGFITILNLSISASWIILAVILVRAIFKKMPKVILRFLWLLVGLRLIIPFSIESSLSLVPNVQPLSMETIYTQNMEYTEKAEEFLSDMTLPKETWVGEVNDTTNVPVQTEGKVKGTEFLVTIVSGGWICGISGMVLYALASMIRLKRKVKTAIRMKDNIWQCEYVESPFILGVFKPQIYVPFHMSEQELEYIVEHENTHLKHKDHIVKPIAFLILSIHWFNPLVWIAYVLLCRDIEFACDEQVIKAMSVSDKKGYSETLLSFGVEKKTMLAYPLAFGEVGIKARIKAVLDYKRPRLWLIVLAIISCVIVAVCFLTNPKGTKQNFEDAPNYIETTHFVEEWASAFSDRNADFIVEHATKHAQKTLEEEGLLVKEDTYNVFGWSSPWPMYLEKGYSIIFIDENTAEINYYAWTSDPHFTIWREIIHFSLEKGKYNVTEEETIFLDNISTPEEFTLAYPGGKLGDVMDYQKNGCGEALNNNAKGSDIPLYKGLLEPVSAATILLNLSEDTSKVAVTSEIISENQVALVKITFFDETIEGSLTSSDSYIQYTMVKPYGEDGIWIPSASSDNNEGAGNSINSKVTDYGELVEKASVRDEYGFYGYIPNFLFWSEYELYQSSQGEDFLEKYYTLINTIDVDISEIDGVEKVEIYTGNIGDGDSGFVLFKDAEGNIIQTDFAHNARAGWNSVYVGSADGVDFIMNLYYEDRDSYGGYGFAVWRMDANGDVEFISNAGMDWGVEYKYNDEMFKEFMEEFTYYMSRSYLVLSTQGGEVRTENINEEDKYNYETLKRK